MTAAVSIISALRTPSRNGLPGWRFGLLALVVCGAGALMVYRLVSLQVLHPERYVEHGESQRIRSEPLVAERGSIVDRNGVELAVSTPQPSLWADPRLVIDPVSTAQQVGVLAGADIEQLTTRLSNGDAKFAWLARQVDQDLADAVLGLALPGVYATEEQTRISPGGSDIARGIVGRTDVDGIGWSGLEMQYNDVLTGDEGRVVVERGLGTAGRRAVTIPDGRYELVAPVAGNSLVLTLDRTIQFEVENLLKQHVAAAGAASGTVVVSRPSTGEILAMATVARTSNGQVAVSGDNRAVTTIIEPGSISKPLAMSALIEEGLANARTTVKVTDEIEIYDVRFTDPIRHETDTLTAAQVLETSSNVGIALLVDRLSDEQLHQYLDAFGIGLATDLDFPGESAGILEDADDWSGVSRPFAAIGYGYAATPLQMLRAYNVLANDGLLVEPYVVSGITSPTGEFQMSKPSESIRVLSSATARTVTSMLAGVVENGTGQLASVPGYEIAGKTGTARIAQAGGGYEDDEGEIHHITSFAGYLPASAPELSLIVIIEDPEGDASGGRDAAPLFGEISNFALQHLRIPPAVSATGSDG